MDTSFKEQVSFESWEKKKLLQTRFSVKFVLLLVRSIALANWFACVPAWTSAIAQVSLTSLQQKPVHLPHFARKLKSSEILCFIPVCILNLILKKCWLVVQYDIYMTSTKQLEDWNIVFFFCLVKWCKKKHGACFFKLGSIFEN